MTAGREERKRDVRSAIDKILLANIVHFVRQHSVLAQLATSAKGSSTSRGSGSDVDSLDRVQLEKTAASIRGAGLDLAEAASHHTWPGAAFRTAGC